MAKDYYAILGLQKGASAEDVKKAYRRLSKELHPDKHKGDKAAETRFKEVNEAYEVLSNPQKKQMYDQFGEAGVNGGAGGFSGFGGGGQGAGGFDFSQFGGSEGFADLFEGFFGGGRQRAQRQEGGDLETEATIDLTEVVTGVRRTIKVRKLVRCDRCDGSGAEQGSSLKTCDECGGTGQVTRVAQSFFGVVQQRIVCPRCRGSGKIPEKACKKCDGEGRVSETLEMNIDIPAGIADGQSLRLRGEGDAGRRGSAAGDLYIRIHVRPDPRFEREDQDIRSTVEITALDAILGTTIDIPTVQGSVSLKIPEGTQPDQIFRVKGKGLPILNTHRFGDHYVTVKVKVPTRLSREERKILEEWKKARS
jgi:molecular chaperone DnaJ